MVGRHAARKAEIPAYHQHGRQRPSTIRIPRRERGYCAVQSCLALARPPVEGALPPRWRNEKNAEENRWYQREQRQDAHFRSPEPKKRPERRDPPSIAAETANPLAHTLDADTMSRLDRSVRI